MSLNRTRRAGLTWPLPPSWMTMSGSIGFIRHHRICLAMTVRSRIREGVHRELRRPSVTLMLLWEEYCDTSSDGFSYSWFCERYKEWAGRLKPTLRRIMSPARSCSSTIRATPWR